MDTSKWQTSCTTLKERGMYMHNNSLFSDVKFSVVNLKGDMVTIPAHKYVLAISSPVYEAMFYGELAETRRTIDLTDCTAEGLLELFRYMYYDEVELNGSNVMEVLHLAKKYIVPSLAKKCLQYLEKELGPEDVFTVLPQAMKLDETELEQLCWNIVDAESYRAMTSEPFLEVTQEILCKVLERDTLSLDEIEVFQAADRWASKKIRDQGLRVNGETKRNFLGEKAVHFIRFPVMSEKRFAEVVLNSEILELKEVTELVKYYNSVALTPINFTMKSRTGIQRLLSCQRFEFGSFYETSVRNCVYKGTKADSITFTVSRTVTLVGVRLFGSRGSHYNVDLKVFKEAEQSLTIYETDTISTFNTDIEKKDGYYGFTVTLKTPLHLEPDVPYTIKALIKGPASIGGEDGCEEVQCQDVKFTFMPNTTSPNGTSYKKGQFPDLLFYR